MKSRKTEMDAEQAAVASDMRQPVPQQEPTPHAGGSYIRNADGSLSKTGAGVDPATDLTEE